MTILARSPALAAATPVSEPTDPAAPQLTPCIGDCDGTGSVSINELVTLVNIALGTTQPSACPNGVPSATGVTVAVLVQAVNDALSRCPGPSPTPTATSLVGTVTKTPTRTATVPTPTSSVTPVPTMTASATRSVTNTSTSTATPVSTPTLKPGDVLIKGSCSIPTTGGDGRGPCPPATDVSLWRCVTNASCVQNEKARREINHVTIDEQSRFAIEAPKNLISAGNYVLIAQMGAATQDTPTPTATPAETPPLQAWVGSFGCLHSGGCAGAGADLAEVQHAADQIESCVAMTSTEFDIGAIDPDSTGAANAVDLDGLDNFSGQDLCMVLTGTRNRPHDFKNDNIESASLRAQEFAQTLILPQLSIETSTDGRVAYFVVQNSSIFDYVVTTVAIDLGTGDGGVNSCEIRGIEPGGAAVGDDVPDLDNDQAQVQTTGLLAVSGSIVPSGNGVCANEMCYAFGDSHLVLLKDGQPADGLPAASLDKSASFELGTCALNGKTYFFPAVQPTPSTTPSVPTPTPTTPMPTARAFLGDAPPADGFHLLQPGHKNTIVFAVQTTVNPLGFGIGGFRLDDNGMIVKGLARNIDHPSGREQVALGPTDPALNRVSVAGFPKAVLLRDLNNDGLPDLVVADEAANAVSVRLQAQNANFTQLDSVFPAPAQYPAAGFPATEAVVALAVGDVTGDGPPDIVTANEGTGTVALLTGNGDGKFAAQAQEFTLAAPAPVAVALGDLGNGHVDIVTAHEPSGLSVILNHGGGNFDAAKFYPGGSYPSALAVADANNDQHAFVVTADEGSGMISVWLSTGGALSAAKTYDTTLRFPRAMAVADFDKDGRLDVAVTSETDHMVAVLLNQGDGSFPIDPQKPQVYPVFPRLQCVGVQPCPAGLFPIAMAAGDVDGDGYPDLFVANEGSGDVVVLLNDGTGHFDPPRNFSAAPFPLAIAAGDVNGDGSDDVVVVGHTFGAATLLLSTSKSE